MTRRPRPPSPGLPRPPSRAQQRVLGCAGGSLEAEGGMVGEGGCVAEWGGSA